MEERNGYPHRLELKERKELTVTGVTEVVSFDEEAVVLKTSLGTLMVHGRGLQLKTLSVNGGQVEVSGTVSAGSVTTGSVSAGRVSAWVG